jgi:hypothetical protein
MWGSFGGGAKNFEDFGSFSYNFFFLAAEIRRRNSQTSREPPLFRPLSSAIFNWRILRSDRTLSPCAFLRSLKDSLVNASLTSFQHRIFAMSLQPIALYGLEVPPGSILIPAMTVDSFPDAAVSVEIIDRSRALENVSARLHPFAPFPPCPPAVGQPNED